VLQKRTVPSIRKLTFFILSYFFYFCLYFGINSRQFLLHKMWTRHCYHSALFYASFTVLSSVLCKNMSNMSNKLDVKAEDTQFEYCQTFFILFYSRCIQVNKYIFSIYVDQKKTFPHFFLLVISTLSHYLCNSLLTNAAISDRLLKNS